MSGANPNPGANAGSAVLCRLDDLADPGCREFKWGTGDWPLEFFAVRKDGKISGFVNRCPHAGNPLNWQPDRFLTRDGEFILCNSHGAVFRVADGVCVDGPCPGSALIPVALRIEHGQIVADEAELNALHRRQGGALPRDRA